MQDTTAPAFVYILQCSDNTLYTGCTKDLQRRLKQHQQGKAAKYTHTRRPVTLVYSEKQPTYNAALSREISIKKLNRKQKLELISKHKYT